MIKGLLKGIAEASIEKDRLVSLGNKTDSEIIILSIRKIINDSCGLRIGSKIKYTPNENNIPRTVFDLDNFVPTTRTGIVTKMIIGTQIINLTDKDTNGSKNIVIGLLQLRIFCKDTNQYHIINIDEFNTYDDNIDFCTQIYND